MKIHCNNYFKTIFELNSNNNW
ncbi:hypothetical protein DERP_014438 [Dermatophagoides pteronyssinus]|uniref:Uncharacterized protein n=1 Tax=Dermatophagoides pteronyssinus TaxID=6956 RepID=A0ABQ8IW47_DERPT|nr:hypothetical protein DERP_014438 [Dermatophagoides pteronyssinus]